MERELGKLEFRIKSQEDILRKKGEREETLMGEIKNLESRLNNKNSEIKNLQSRLVLFQTFKHKFETKSMEAIKLMQRIEELATLNGDMQDKLMDKQK